MRRFFFHLTTKTSNPGYERYKTDATWTNPTEKRPFSMHCQTKIECVRCNCLKLNAGTESAGTKPQALHKNCWHMRTNQPIILWCFKRKTWKMASVTQLHNAKLWRVGLVDSNTLRVHHWQKMCIDWAIGGNVKRRMSQQKRRVQSDASEASLPKRLFFSHAILVHVNHQYSHKNHYKLTLSPSASAKSNQMYQHKCSWLVSTPSYTYGAQCASGWLQY